MNGMESTEGIQEAAEQVRDHLVLLRGGAPFLSPVDSKLLLDWLESGIPVAIILRSLEEVAGRRQARRTRTPFSLKSARSAVNKAMKNRLGRKASATLAPLVQELKRSDNPGERAVADELAALDKNGEPLVEAALKIARRFFQQQLDSCDRAALQLGAETELEDLKPVLTETQWERAVLEVMRQQIRDDHPLLSAASIWDTVFR